MSDFNSKSGEQKPKHRSATSITLGWLAEKLRHTEKVKEQVKSGTYRVDSSALARSLLNKD